jgi:DNA-binding NarL/FixJ family response regulator
MDENLERRNRLREKLQAHGFHAVEAETEAGRLVRGRTGTPDLIVVCLDSTTEPFYKLAAELHGSGTFLVPFIETSFSLDFRKEILALKADGFINESVPVDEWIATLNALIQKKRDIDQLNLALKQKESHPMGSRRDKNNCGTADPCAPLRDREPELYRNMLRLYEEGVKLVLRRRIYKINDDIFEPFRKIAKELFQARATARDAVQLHYQTLRKLAPAADAPRAQGYLEVGRTTIIGLMGDLLTYYRDEERSDSPEVTFTKSASPLSPRQS